MSAKSESRSEAVLPVLIVGGGPVGLLCAILLSKAGIRSLVIDRHPERLIAPKAHVVNPRSVEIFRSVGFDIAEMRRRAAPVCDSAHVRFMTSLAGRELGSLDYERQDPGVLEFTPTPLMNLPQPKLEEFFLEEVKRSRLIELRRGVSWKAVQQSRKGLCSTVVTNGQTQTIESKYLLGCDGASSTVRSALGVGMHGQSQVQTCLTIYFQANLRKIVGERTAIIYWCINDKVAGAFVAHDIDRDWIFIRFDSPNDEPGKVFSEGECRDIVLAAIGKEVPLKICHIAPWMMTSEVADRYGDGNVFLVGDAAHRFPPNGGLGVNTGIQDAHNLIWKIAAVEEGWAQPALLRSYQVERQPVAEANAQMSLSNAKTMPRLIKALVEAGTAQGTTGNIPLEMEREARDAIAENAATYSLLGFQLGFTYSQSAAPLERGDIFIPSARVGDRMPHAWLRDGRSTLDLLDAHAFTLLGRVDSPNWQRLTDNQPVPVRIVCVSDGDGVVQHWFDVMQLHDEARVLIRPDGHILARVHDASDASANELLTALRDYVSGARQLEIQRGGSA